MQVTVTKTPVRRVAVYVRTPVAAETERRQDTVLARIGSLRENGAVDDLTVTYWNRAANVTADDPTLPSVVAMEQWAAANGVTLAPAFDRHDRSCWFTGVDDSVVTLPVICLAVFENDDLVGVYPHLGPSGPQSVGDCLDRLEAEFLPDP